ASFVMTFGTSHYALKDRTYLQPADKSLTTNACLPPGPVRQTLFSTLVDYTSSITRRSGPTVRVSFLLRLFRGAYYSRSQGGRQTLPVLCRRTEGNAVSRAWTDERSMDRSVRRLQKKACSRPGPRRSRGCSQPGWILYR